MSESKMGERGPLQIMIGTRHAPTKVKSNRWQIKCSEYYSSCSTNFRYIISQNVFTLNM
jgi:hypothetical protein